jgi:hypothetical protein
MNPSVSGLMGPGAVSCIGLWIIMGGWGPAEPGLFGAVGLFGGILAGLAVWMRLAG